MAKRSAGLLLYRRRPELQVFLVYPGGPFFVRKDQGSWTIPKGEYGDDEDPLAAAVREFEEETGIAPVMDECLPLSTIKQKGGKSVMAWAIQHDVDPTTIVSNTFTMEWPPKSGKMASFPEIDRGAWFAPADAREKINPAQAVWLDELDLLISTSMP